MAGLSSLVEGFQKFGNLYSMLWIRPGNMKWATGANFDKSTYSSIDVLKYKPGRMVRAARGGGQGNQPSLGHLYT